MDLESIKSMSDADVVAQLRSGSRLEKARAAFSSACGRIEQAGQQRTPLLPIPMRRMEYEAVVRIVEALGLEMPRD